MALLLRQWMETTGSLSGPRGIAMSLTVTDLAEEVRETNRRLTAAIDALRTEVTDLRVEVAKINTNLNWLKR